jgi:CHAT domain-containing protein
MTSAPAACSAPYIAPADTLDAPTPVLPTQCAEYRPNTSDPPYGHHAFRIAHWPTAAGGSESAEALSGLSRAFFYAGARALLVSHWAVDLDVAVKLITKTLSTMAADKTVGRSEALRRSMVSLIEQGKPYEAHPAYWAPFIVVGEGSTESAPVATSSIVPGPEMQQPAKPQIRPKKKAPDHRLAQGGLGSIAVKVSCVS